MGVFVAGPSSSESTPCDHVCGVPRLQRAEHMKLEVLPVFLLRQLH